MEMPDSVKRKRKKPPKFSLLEKAEDGSMTKRDWLFVLSLTILCGLITLPFMGDTKAPQTFWRSMDDETPITIDLGQEVQLDNLLYYAGINREYSHEWILELSSDGENWQIQPWMSHWYERTDLFNWLVPMLDNPPIPTRYIRITPDTAGMELGELALFIRDENGERVQFDMLSLTERHPQYAALFDEQFLVPSLPDLDNIEMIEIHNATISSNRNGMYFDEIYHASTAYEFIHRIDPTEVTHPPLGKILISLGISIFGMNPFGWRIMSILFGVLMIPLMYVFIKNLFGNTKVAVCGGLLFVFENMRFTLTNMAMLEAFLVFFIIAMYLFMYRFISSGYEAPLKKIWLPLFLCGVSFGFAAATKWSAFFAALGLVVLYIAYLIERRKCQIAMGRKKEFQLFLKQTLLASVAFFVVIPAIIYTLSYIPVTLALGHKLTLGTLIRDMWEKSLFALSFHSDEVVGLDHYFQSSWWMWMLNIRPVQFFRSSFIDSGHMLGVLINPLIAIGGLVAIWFALLTLVRKKVWELFLIIAGFFANLIPWIPVMRNSFIYHYFPSVVFLILAICYIFSDMIKNRQESTKRIYLFTGVSTGLFLLLLPVSAGIPVPEWYTFRFMRWLPTWLY